MPQPPAGFRDSLRQLRRNLSPLRLTAHELEFLLLVAACPTVVGSVVAMDDGFSPVFDVLTAGLQLAPPESPRTLIAFRTRSLAIEPAAQSERQWMSVSPSDAAPEWNLPIRLLWLGGDSTYIGVKSAFDAFRRHLSNGAIVAFPNVLSTDESSLVFRKAVIPSAMFGEMGLCDTIGWAQAIDPQTADEFDEQRDRLARRLAGILPIDSHEAITSPWGHFRRAVNWFRLRRDDESVIWRENAA